MDRPPSSQATRHRRPPSREYRCRCRPGLRIRERGNTLIIVTEDDTEIVLMGAVALARCGNCGAALRNVAVHDQLGGSRR